METLNFCIAFGVMSAVISFFFVTKKLLEEKKQLNMEFFSRVFIILSIGGICIFSELGGAPFFRGLSAGVIFSIVFYLSRVIERKYNLSFMNGETLRQIILLNTFIGIMLYLTTYPHWAIGLVVIFLVCFVVEYLHNLYNCKQAEKVLNSPESLDKKAYKKKQIEENTLKINYIDELMTKLEKAKDLLCPSGKSCDLANCCNSKGSCRYNAFTSETGDFSSVKGLSRPYAKGCELALYQQDLLEKRLVELQNKSSKS